MRFSHWAFATVHWLMYLFRLRARSISPLSWDWACLPWWSKPFKLSILVACMISAIMWYLSQSEKQITPHKKNYLFSPIQSNSFLESCFASLTQMVIHLLKPLSVINGTGIYYSVHVHVSWKCQILKSNYETIFNQLQTLPQSQYQSRLKNVQHISIYNYPVQYSIKFPSNHWLLGITVWELFLPGPESYEMKHFNWWSGILEYGTRRLKPSKNVEIIGKQREK